MARVKKCFLFIYVCMSRTTVMNQTRRTEQGGRTVKALGVIFLQKHRFIKYSTHNATPLTPHFSQCKNRGKTRDMFEINHDKTMSFTNSFTF